MVKRISDNDGSPDFRSNNDNIIFGIVAIVGLAVFGGIDVSGQSPNPQTPDNTQENVLPEVTNKNLTITVNGVSFDMIYKEIEFIDQQKLPSSDGG